MFNPLREIYGGGGGGEHGNDGALQDQDGTCFNYIFGEVASGCGFCGDCSNLGAGVRRDMEVVIQVVDVIVLDGGFGLVVVRGVR